MIPKIIHTFWFSNDPKPDNIKLCLNSWKENMPDYEIRIWNLQRTKKYHNKFFRQCIRKKMYAFASDYMRFCILQKHGGIYLDLDMLFVKPLPRFMLEDKQFLAMQNQSFLDFAIIGSAPNNHSYLKIINEHYQGDFDYFNPPVLPQILTNYFLQFKRDYPEEITIYPRTVFYPLPSEKRNENYKLFIEADTVAVHLWNFGWKSIFNKKKGPALILALLYDFMYGDYSRKFTIHHLQRIISSGLKKRIPFSLIILYFLSV